MKKWIIIFLIATFVSAIVAISFFLFQKREGDLLSKVPKNAKSVFIIDLQALTAKLFFDEIASETKSADKLTKLVPDSLVDIDWSTSGISMLDRIILFTTENASNDSIRLNLVLRIANAEEFDEFIKGLVKSIGLEIMDKENEKMAYSKQYQTLIKWNDNFVVASIHSKNQLQDRDYLSDILSVKKEESIMMDSNLMDKLVGDYDLLAYSLPYSKHPQKYSPFINSNIESVTSLIRFKDGELEFKAVFKPKKGSLLEKLFMVPQKELTLLNTSDNYSLNATLNVNPLAFFQILEQYQFIKFNRKKVPFLIGWDGRLNLSVNGSKIIESEYISYAYDDDFNKMEIIKTRKDKIWDIQAVLGTNEVIMDSVFRHGHIYKSNKDTLLFKAGNFIIKKTDDSYLCYNKHVVRPKVQGTLKTENISIELNGKKFIPLLKELGIKPDSLWLNKLEFKKLRLNVAKKEAINFSCSFYFADMEKNSFFSIAEKLE